MSEEIGNPAALTPEDSDIEYSQDYWTITDESRLHLAVAERLVIDVPDIGLAVLHAAQTGEPQEVIGEDGLSAYFAPDEDGIHIIVSVGKSGWSIENGES